ncbi:MAG: rhomboid family intramembrane serine protease [Rubrobacter sp.]|nr:rhomboid family intramembrane serine protease [Rubrobacter sp.]
MRDLARLPVTFSLILACVLVYAGVMAVGVASGIPWNVVFVTQPPEILIKGSLAPALVAQGQVWRLVTSMFLHSGLTHLALNMISLYFLGYFAELTFGRGRFLALYVLSGLSGGIAYLYFGGFDGSAVGASGAIFGILGGVLGFAARRGSFSWQNPVIRQLLLLLAFNLLVGASIPNISITAHVGGLVGGAAFGWLATPTIYSEKGPHAGIPVAILLGLEALLLAAWFVLL